MKFIHFYLIIFSFIFIISGCTQVVTAPLSVAGTVVSTTIDVAGSAVHAVAKDDEEEKNE